MSKAGPLRVGLTGGIASGKSTVCARLASHGVTIIDADLVAREVVAPTEPALAEIVAHFGPEIVDAHGALDRARLRARVFSDSAQRHALERIVHPRVLQRMRARAQLVGGPYCVLAIPLLVETTADHRWLDAIVVIDVPEELQLRRLCQRDGIDESLARAMLAAQASRAQRRAVADEVLDNGGDLPALERACDLLHQRLLARVAARSAN